MKTSVRWILICFCLISIAPSGDVPSRGPVMKIRGDCSNDARLCKVNRSKKLCQKKIKIKTSYILGISHIFKWPEVVYLPMPLIYLQKNSEAGSRTPVSTVRA